MKKILALVTAGLLAAGMIGMAGCAGPSDEQLIRDSLTQQLDAYKNKDDAALSAMASFAESEQLAEAGIDAQELASVVLDGFDYSIDAVEVDGTTANATVTIVSKSSSDLQERLNELMQTFATDPSLEGLSQEEIVDKLAESVMQAFQEAEIVTETAEIEYQLNDNTWEPTKGANALADLDSAVFAQ